MYPNPQIDMDKLAEGLQKLGEEDLLQVVSMIVEHKTTDTFTKNDPERMFSLSPLLLLSPSPLHLS